MGELWYGGTIYTMNRERETIEAVFVEDGKIVATGERKQLKERYKHTIQIERDIQGSVMLPGLTDSHMHLIGHGERLLRLDLSDCTSYEEMLLLVKEKAMQTETGEWIIGEGWNENAFSDTKELHAYDLDRISAEHPILLKRVCRHAVLVNSVVLRAAHITSATPKPKGGRIGIGGDGEPNGLLYDRAMNLVDDILPKQTEEYIQRALKMAMEDCWGHGLVGGHTEDLNYYGGFARTYQAFTSILGKTNRFKAHLLVHHEVVNERRSYMDTQYIEFGAMKIFADGSLGGRTALLSMPYTDAPNTNGVAIFEPEELAALVAKARTLGMTVAVHTIGDLSFEYILDALRRYPPRWGQRDRLIHCQVLREDLIEKAKHLPVVLDIQPVFGMSDFPSVIDKLGPDRLQYAYEWRTLLGSGFVCAGGSDAPIEQVNPFLGMYSAVTRKSRFDGNVYGPKEKLTMFEAVSLFTYGSAYAIQRENSRGKIAPGYDADFTIIDRDIFQIDHEEVPHTRVNMTVVDGAVVYER